MGESQGDVRQGANALADERAERKKRKQNKTKKVKGITTRAIAP